MGAATRFRIATASVAVLTGVSIGLSATAGSALATTNATATRIAGIDRWDTAARLATTTFPQGAANVVLASGTSGHFADALVGAYLAGQLGAPILLTSSNGAIPSATMTALSTLHPSTVYVLGQSNAVPAAQQDALVAAGYHVARIGGADRYETAKLVDETPTAQPGTINGVKTATVVTGENFADATAAGSLSYAAKLPVIVTTTNSLSPAAQATLTDLGIKQVVIAGGTGAVSAPTEAAINAGGVTTVFRAAGTDRSDTARLLADWGIAHAGMSDTGFVLASGDQFYGGADALASGPFAGAMRSPILLSDRSDALGAAATFAWAHEQTEDNVDIIGGTLPITPLAADTITSAAQTAPRAAAIAVTPTTPATQQVTTTATNSDRQYQVTGLDDATTYTISFFDPSMLTTDGGFTFFQRSLFHAVPSSLAAQLGVGNAKLTLVNGSAPASATLATAKPNGGSISFTLEGTAASGSVVPIVFVDANANQQLDLLETQADANPRPPAETFGLGGQITYTP